ncbi:DUF4185 domain-containing protein [Telmatospirillum sp. J64-1]|uniref:DUF4185 domain-containing protein n=1 Tax=Telmatospirillum sp. J64-1 TaxID=2502183 RepID=UPI00163D5922|nr:DUF4185 domain-containing protein [Telmatospirillum sp. J64-1]
MDTIIAQPNRRKPWLLMTAAVFLTLTGPSASGQAPALSVPGDVMVDRTETRKICQVTGEIDRSTGEPTINLTESRYKFWGTDLGTSFEHDGRLVVLFGDTHAMPGLDRKPDRDIVAFSDTTNPEDCLALDIPTEADGGFRPMTIPTVDGGPFSVPTAGFSANGAMYVIATSDKTPHTPMGRSVLAKSTNGGADFEKKYDLSTSHFINAAAATVDSRKVAGLPEEMEDAVLLWGSGLYRRSDVRLAALPTDGLDDKAAIRYFAGLDQATGSPIWSHLEEDSAPLFDQPCVGELSVTWNEYLGKWVMLYNCGYPKSQILFRTADQPWGPWAESQVLFDASEDNAFCDFIYNRETMIQMVSNDGVTCQTISDPHTPDLAGDPYAPFQIARFARGEHGSHSDIYFLMSTWNPYNVVLMKTRLYLPDANPLHQASNSEKSPS